MHLISGALVEHTIFSHIENYISQDLNGKSEGLIVGVELVIQINY